MINRLERTQFPDTDFIPRFNSEEKDSNYRKLKIKVSSDNMDIIFDKLNEIIDKINELEKKSNNQIENIRHFLDRKFSFS